jgi:ADP-ribose pyrophosphatase
MIITKVEKLTNEKWLNLFAATFEHNGHNGRWVYASRKKQAGADHTVDAVVIVPVLHAEGKPPRLVMVREFRIPINAYSLAFPAGLLEDGESIEETVRREMIEETGLEVVRFTKISPPLYSSTGMTDEAAVLAFVDVRETPGGKAQLEASEVLEMCLLDFADVCRLCDNPGGAIDAKAWSTLYLFQKLGRLD